MAEEALAPIFKGAFGGIADDIFSGLVNSYASSYNINIRDNSKSIKLNYALVKDSSTTITELLTEIIKLSAGGYMGFGDAGGIYLKATTTRAKVTTNTPATKILSAREFNGFVYWTQAAKLHKIAIGNVSTNITTTEVLNFANLESAIYHPMLVSMGSMYVGNKYKLNEVNILGIFDDVYTVENNSVVKKITDLGSSLRILTISEDGNNNFHLWNRPDTEPTQTIPIIGYNIKQYLIHKGYNFITTNKGIAILDGYNVITMKENSNFNNNIGSIAVFDEKLYIGGTGGIYVYGGKDKNYPDVLNFQHRVSTGLSDDIIGAIFSDGIDLYVSWSSTTGGTTTYGVDKLSNTTYALKGELITRGYYANTLYAIKSGINIMNGFKPLITGQSIVISYSLDGGDYTELITIESTTNIKRGFTEDVFTPGEFQYIQFKIELNGPGTSTPEFYCTDLFFNNNIGR